MAEPPVPPGLAREASVFARYLARIEATPYILERYAAGHRHLPAGTAIDRVDLMLLRAATASPVAARLADAYARRFRPTGVLRQKLVLLLAILESSPPAHGWLNSAERGSLARVLLGIALTGLASLGCLGAGLAWFGPRHLLLGLRGREHA